MESNELTQTLLTEKQTGTYGVVYRGTLNGMHDVAIKVVEDEEELSSQETEDIDPEVEAWYLNNHISIKIKTHSDSAYVVFTQTTQEYHITRIPTLNHTQVRR